MKERVTEVNRVFHGQIDRRFLAAGSDCEKVIIKSKDSQTVVRNAKPSEIDSDEIIWK